MTAYSLINFMSFVGAYPHIQYIYLLCVWISTHRETGVIYKGRIIIVVNNITTSNNNNHLYSFNCLL